MKKIITHILILVLLVGLFSPTLVSAQTPSFSGCTGGMMGAFGIDIFDCITNILVWILFGILSIIALILMLAGWLLDFVLRYTIIDMRGMLDSFVGINIAWKILKDIMNIAFIFILVYEGIKLIIGQGSKEHIKKFIFGVVMASILINFSLFFTKVLIDASNIVTVGLYDSIIDRGNIEIRDPNTNSLIRITGLSVPIMNAVGLSSFYSSNTFSSMSQSAGGNWNILFIPIFGVFLFLITSFVFMAVSVMFVVRFLTLLILLMLSPIAYMGLGLTFMKPYASKWWNALNSQLIFPPVFMLMMLVTITLITAPNFLTTTGDWAGFLNTTDPTAQLGFIDLIFKFAIVIGLTIASLVISKSVSTQGSSHISTATSKLSGYAGAAVMGGSARFGRSTLGRYGSNVANDEDLKDRAARGDIGARLKLAAANRMSTSTFDGRATSSFGSVAKASGFGKDDFGKVDAKKQNFRAIQEQKAKDQEELLKRYKPSDLSVQRIKDQLDSKEFKAKEEEEKRKHLESDEFKEKSVYKNAKKAEEENNQLDQLTKKQKTNAEKIKELEKGKDLLIGAELIARNEEMDKLNKEIAGDKLITEKLKETAEERKKALAERKNYEDLYMSKTKEDLIARSGGQEKKEKDGRITQQAVTSQYQVRADQIAKNYNESALYKYGHMASGALIGGIVGGAPGFLGGGYLAKKYFESETKSNERAEIARRIKKAAGGKKKAEDLVKDLLKETGEVKEEDEKKEEKKEEKPAEGGESKTTT